LSDPSIATLFNNTKAPYNISTLTSKVASEALTGKGLEVYRNHVQEIKRERKRLQGEIVKLSFVSRLLGDHDANFILAQIVDPKSGKPDNDLAHRIYKTLAEVEGVVVRFRGMEMGCEGALRITVGTRQENDILLEKLKAFFQ